MNRNERRAITRLIDTFGADVAVSLRPRPEMDRKARLRAQQAAEDRIENCNACELRAACGDRTPLVPYWSPALLPRAGRVAALVDAPTIEEHRRGTTGVGPLYRTVREELRDNGITPDNLTWLTAVSCTPINYHPRRGETRRPPERHHVDACAANVDVALNAADVSYALLLGAHAVRVWRSDLKAANLRGRWFLWKSRWMVYVAEHPGVLLGGRRQTGEATGWREDIARFCRDVNGRVGLEALSSGCIRPNCSGTHYAWDDDGVPFCREHFKAGKFTRANRDKPRVNTAQGSLL